jgi:hypothetical protein
MESTKRHDAGQRKPRNPALQKIYAKNPDAFAHVNLAAFDRMAEVSPQAWQVYTILLLYRDWDTGECFPSVGTIAQIAGRHSNNVRKSLHELADKKLIKIEPRSKERGGHDNNLYTVLTDAPVPTKAQVLTEAREGDTCAGARGIPAQAHQELNHKNKTKKNETKGAADAALDWPPSLDCDEARAAFAKWLGHRREIRKPLKLLSQQALLDKWASNGAERFAAAVDHSIAQGWQGLFEPNTAGRAAKSKSQLNTEVAMQWLAGQGGPNHE